VHSASTYESNPTPKLRNRNQGPLINQKNNNYLQSIAIETTYVICVNYMLVCVYNDDEAEHILVFYTGYECFLLPLAFLFN
jgi:hypothetical protein